MIDTGVLGVKTTDTLPSDTATVMDAEMAVGNDDSTKTNEASATKKGKGKKKKPRGTKEEAERIYKEAASIEELTVSALCIYSQRRGERTT